MIHEPDDARASSNALYKRVAGIYGAWVRIGSLGAFPHLYRRGCQLLHLTTGNVVLDVCCGTGELFPFLSAAVGPTGRVIGCDISPEMLVRARARIRKSGWDRVEAFESDALSFVPPFKPDAAIFCICLSAIPWRSAVLDHVIRLLPPNAPVVIIDSLTLEKRLRYLPANLYNRVKGHIISADPDCGLRRAAAERLNYFTGEIWAGGIYSVLAGRTPSF
jgi:ubiquinone/menaquinone biosynthesis C-methylase UbiE